VKTPSTRPVRDLIHIGAPFVGAVAYDYGRGAAGASVIARAAGSMRCC